MQPIDEAVEAERLRHVRALIEATLKEFDVCAQVVLAGRAGRFENFTDLRASWSRVRLIQDDKGRSGIGLRSQIADYQGDKAAQKRDLEWSLGMVSGFGEIGAQVAMGWLEAANALDSVACADHTPMRRDDPRDEP